MAVKIGDRVEFKNSGKCARLEGMSGKKVLATVTAVHDDGISVMCDHRKEKTATFFNMGTRLFNDDKFKVVVA